METLMKEMKKSLIIVQVAIIILHFIMITDYKIKQNRSIELLNKRAYELRDATVEFNKALEEINPKLDSLNKHKPCFK